MASKRNTRFAMTKDEKVAHRKELGRIRQQRGRDKRKKALSLLPPENLSWGMDHYQKKMGRIHQQRWRDERKNALSLVPLENLPRCTDHYLEKMVQSDLENKAKAQKRAKKITTQFQ